MMCSAAVFTLALPVQAHADQAADMQSEINELSAQLQSMNAKLKTMEAEQARAHANAAAEAAHDREVAAAIQMRQQQDEAAAAARTAARQAQAAAEFQAVAPTRAQKQGLLGNQYVTNGALPRSILVPGTNTSLRISGFINFQGIYDATTNLGPKFAIGNLPPNGPQRSATKDDFHFQSKVSRMILQTSTPSSFGPVTTNFALDFYGFTNGGDYNQALQNNSYSARIVYSYGTIGPLTLGLLNSNFIDDPDTAETFDNAGPAGVPAERTEQIRYTWLMNKTSVFNVAAEDP